MRFVRVWAVRCVLAAGAAVVFATMLGCAGEPEPEITKITFDGKAYEFGGPVSSVHQLDGGLLITAPPASGWPGGTPPGRGKKLVRVELLEDPRLVVEIAALRFDDVRGFTDASDEMWGTKVGDVYAVNGRMPDDDGTHWHQFTIEVTCSHIDDRYATRFGAG